MTDYTKDDHALPYPEGGDKVAVHSDIQALAVRTGIAMTLSESSARVASNNYTDGVARSLRAYADAAGAESVSDANAYTDDQVEGIREHYSTSHIALDTDGVPFFSPGSMTVQIRQDADGVPYFEAA